VSENSIDLHIQIFLITDANQDLFGDAKEKMESEIESANAKKLVQLK
jgi:hypothetical protein